MKDNFIKIFNKFIDLIDSSKTQKKLTKINITLSLVSLIYIISIILDIYNKISIKINFELSEIVLLIMFYFTSGTLWSKFLVSNYKGDFRKYFFNWSYSKIGKYIPSGLLTITTRLNQDLPKDSDSKKIFFGLLEEQFLIPLISIIPLGISIYFKFEVNRFVVYLVSLICTFILFKFIYKYNDINFISITNQNLLFLFNQIFPIVIYFEIAKNLNYSDPLLISLIYLLSTYIGLLFVGVPAAIGIREAIFIFASIGFYDEIYLFSFFIKTRILLIALDLIFGCIGIINQKLLKSSK